MKKLNFTQHFIALIFVLFTSLLSLTAQTTADFENLSLSPDSSWNGSDGSGSFSSGNASFANKFMDWGGGITSWSGFAYTNRKDTITQSYNNEFSVMTGEGFSGSANYAVGYFSPFDPLPTVRLSGIAHGDTVSGFFVTNSTYSYLTMKNGGGPAKKFGGVSGTDPDWFYLVVYGYFNGVKLADSVQFYLADFRFSNSAQDYILKDWQWVDLTSLGKVDSLQFSMNSSDIGSFGINNPTYFCMDNLITNHNSFIGIEKFRTTNISVFPNPCSDMISFEGGDWSAFEVIAADGKKVMYGKVDENKINIQTLPRGVYYLKISSEKATAYSKFIIN